MDGVTSGYEQVVRVDNYLTSLKMTIDSSDNPIIVYGGSRNIFISRWNGTEWTQMDEVTSGFENISNNDNAESPMVKLDNHGLPVVFWSDDIAGDGDIFISRWNGTEWTQMDEVTSGYEIIYSNGGTGDVYVTDLLFNEDNYPILSWAERMISGGGAYDIFISRWNGSEWTQMDGVTSGHENISNTTNESSLQGSIAMNSFGDIFATWQDTIGGRNVILVVFWNGVAWTQMNGITPGYEIVSDPTVHSYWPSGISFDDLGNPVLAWHTYTDGTYQIAVSRWNGTEWTQMDGVSSGYDLVSNSDNDSEFVSLITDDMNYPVVSWVEDSGFIFISRWNGSSWTQMDSSTPGYEKVLDASSVTMNGERPQILLGDNNNPIVGWRDNSSGHYRIKTSFYDPIYISPAIIQSTKISGLLEDEILRATLEAEDSTPGASRIEYFLSNDGGSTWEEVENGAEHIFSTVGNDLRWKAILYKGSTPTISSVTINYSIESEEDDDDQGEDQQADEPEEDPDPTIKIKEIKENCDFLEIEISTGGEQEHEKLDFKVKIEKTETGEKTEQKIEDFKTDSHGRALLTIDNLEQNTEYKIKVKYKEDDEYTEYSDSKKATTETCQSTQQTVLITEITEDDPISFPGELETQEEQEYVKEEDKQNKEEPTLTIQKEAKTETKEEDPKTKGFWNTLLGGGSSDTEGNSFTKVLAAAIAVVGGVSITTGAWLGRRKLLAFMGFTWMKKRKWRVFDVETGEPIPDVTVILESPEGEILEEEQTDEKGHFKFNASPGNNIIKVSKENYQMIERQEQEIIEEYGEIYTGGSLNNNRDVSLNINIPMRRTREIE